MARSTMANLSKLWNDKNITKITKIHLVQALLFPIATYASESWTLTKADCKKINSFELWCWRKMLKITWVMKRSNKSILQEIGVKKRLLGKISAQTLAYFGHIARRHDSLEKIILQGKIEGSRRPGRPKTRLFDRVKALTGQTTNNIYKLTSDRTKWRAIIEVASCQH